MPCLPAVRRKAAHGGQASGDRQVLNHAMRGFVLCLRPSQSVTRGDMIAKPHSTILITGKIMRYIQHFLIIGILIMYGACSSETPKTKVYFQKKSPMNYIELRGNNSVLLHQEKINNQDKINIIGTYEEDSLLVTLIFFGGRALRMEIKGDTLFDEEGYSWVYWSKGESGWAYERSDGVKKSKALADARQTKDAMINDLNNLAAHAYQYRIRPASMGGGGGSYLGYQIPPKMVSNGNAAYTCIAEADTVRYTAVVTVNRKNGMKVVIDPEGRLTQWQYYGDFKDAGY
jgi:hypothetical protein